MHDGHHHHHDHDHDHSHGHAHSPGGFTAEDEVRALLNYMYGHNKSHANELDLMVDQLDGEAAEKLHEAVHLYEEANEKLHEVLHLISSESEEA